MPVESHEFEMPTRGDCDVIDLTASVARIVADSSIKDGLVVVFVVGSTAAITTTEFEPGLATHDLKAAFQKIAPPDGVYKHEQTWNDDNGHSHICASLVGPSITIPVSGRKMILGAWQQIVLLDFDTRPRTRSIIVQLIGD